MDTVLFSGKHTFNDLCQFETNHQQFLLSSIFFFFSHSQVFFFWGGGGGAGRGKFNKAVYCIKNFFFLTFSPLPKFVWIHVFKLFIIHILCLERTK